MTLLSLNELPHTRLRRQIAERLGAAAPEPSLATTFLAWSRVDQAREHLARLRP